MSRILLLAFLAAATVASTSSQGAAAHVHTHQCAHDSPAVQRAIYNVHRPDDPVDAARGEYIKVLGARPMGRRGAEGSAEPLTSLVSPQRYAGDATDRAFRTASAAPIRIAFRTADLDDPSKYCTSATGTSPMFDGTTAGCSADTVFTNAHRTMLRDVVLPRAAAILSRFLSVVPIVGNLIVSSAPNLCGGQYTVSDADKTTGVPDADIVFYVSAGPNVEGTIAWAGYCALDGNGRPTVARTNFSPKYLGVSTPRDVDHLVRIAVHELLHALGFSGSHIQNNYPQFVTQTTRRGGQPVMLFTGPKALAAAQAHFGCPTLDGIEFEDQGTAGSKGSHWERRTHAQDVMSSMAGDVMTLSAMTFALLEDLGHYVVDYSGAEEDYYMRGSGCGVHEKKCNDPDGGAGRYFCFDESNACTFDYGAIGVCEIGTYNGNLPVWGQYFENPRVGGVAPMMNYCPTVAPHGNMLCNRYDNSFSNHTGLGLYFGSDGRCFHTSSSLYKNNPVDNFPGRCFKSRCPEGTRVEFRVGDAPEWVACPLDGSAAVINAPRPYVGEVTCPKASDFCTPDLYYLPTTTTTTSTTSTTPAPTTTVTTTAPTTMTAAPTTTKAPTTTAAPTTAAPTTTKAPTTTATPTTAAPTTTATPTTAAPTTTATPTTAAPTTTKAPTTTATPTTAAPTTTKAPTTVAPTTAALTTTVATTAASSFSPPATAATSTSPTSATLVSTTTAAVTTRNPNTPREPTRAAVVSLSPASATVEQLRNAFLSGFNRVYGLDDAAKAALVVWLRVATSEDKARLRPNSNARTAARSGMHPAADETTSEHVFGFGGVDGLAALDRFLANVGTDATLRAATGAVAAAEAARPVVQDGDGFGSAASARPAALAAAFVLGALLALVF